MLSRGGQWEAADSAVLLIREQKINLVFLDAARADPLSAEMCRVEQVLSSGKEGKINQHRAASRNARPTQSKSGGQEFPPHTFPNLTRQTDSARSAVSQSLGPPAYLPCTTLYIQLPKLGRRLEHRRYRPGHAELAPRESKNTILLTALWIVARFAFRRCAAGCGVILKHCPKDVRCLSP